MIVATAGHIDHGKTLLVKALTGVDTDRLPEEKRRGLSIDLGFAYTALADGSTLGFVDVPGHERFVRNMIAGVTGIDCALLVVAADDGPMPQTREHLAILDLLGIGNGVVALTKTDRVDAGRVTEAAGEVAALLSSTGLSGAAIHPVSAATGAGIGDLRAQLERVAAQVRTGRRPGGFRLAIDRSFTIDGAGLVVTGSVFSGSVRPGDRLMVSPSGVPVRVRGLHAQNREAAVGSAGQRCAINIAGAKLDSGAVGRGDWLVAEPIHAPSARFDGRIRLLPGEDRALRHWTPVHVHIGAADIPGRVAVLEAGPIASGREGLVQLVLDHPTSALFGDRFILRDQSAQRTIAGGRVIDPFAPARGRARPQRLALLAALERNDPARALSAAFEVSATDFPFGRFIQARNLLPGDVDVLTDAVQPVIVGVGAEAVAIPPGRWSALRENAVRGLAQLHAAQPDTPGVSEGALRRELGTGISDATVAAIVRDLVNDGEIVHAAGNLRLRGVQARLAPGDAELWKRLLPLLDARDLRPPSLTEIGERLGLEVRTVERVLLRAARIGLSVQIARNRFYLPDCLRRLADMAESIANAADAGAVSVAAFRERSGIGRNLAIEILEYFDRVGFTRRAGEHRRILKSASAIDWARRS